MTARQRVVAAIDNELQQLVYDIEAAPEGPGRRQMFEQAVGCHWALRNPRLIERLSGERREA